MSGTQWLLPHQISFEEKELKKVLDIVDLYLPSASEDLENLIYLGRLEVGI